jgi:hypothetical protein
MTEINELTVRNLLKFLDEGGYLQGHPALAEYLSKDQFMELQELQRKLHS